MVQDFKPGDILTLVPNPNYRDRNKPFFNDMIAWQQYGPTGVATTNVLTTPTDLASRNTAFEFNIEEADQILDLAGDTRGSDGVRLTPSGVRLHVVNQTTINSLRQKEQDIVKVGWKPIGIQTELKAIDASVFFSADPGNPDTNGQLLCRRRNVHCDVRLTVPLELHASLLQRQPGYRRGAARQEVVGPQLYALDQH